VSCYKPTKVQVHANHKSETDDSMRLMNIRLVTKQDLDSLTDMPPYCKGRLKRARGEEILIAESGDRILGAVSIGFKEISCVFGDWQCDYEECLCDLIKKIHGGWISKLYVLPEYRLKAVGTRLVEEALKRLVRRGFNEAYAGIYVKNKFRKVSKHVFEKNGFVKIGSCICSLRKEHCRGVLLRVVVDSNERESWTK
jgi:GNAT superfamily N-acetyltransferase